MDTLPCCLLSFALAAPERLSARTALETALRSCKVQEVEETILQSIPYSGFPAAVEALGWLRTQHAYDIPRPTTKESEQSFFGRVYGDGSEKVRASLRERHPDLERWIEQFAYGTVMESSWLPARTIEALAVSSLIGQGRMQPLHSHIRGALRCGHSLSSLSSLLDGLEPVADSEILRTARTLLDRESNDC